jgi:hypothetical protein
MEDIDVTDVRRGEVHPEAVDENALPDAQGRHHGRARNLVRLDDEPLDDDGQAQGDRDDHDQLRH